MPQPDSGWGRRAPTPLEAEPEFAGRWDHFDRTWVFPKPAQRPLPIGFGANSDVGMRYATELADEWYPIDIALEEHGGLAHPTPDEVASYAQFGVERVVVGPSSIARHSAAVTLQRLDEFASLITTI